MQAVILAAGKGKRLLPLTQSVPKPLVEVAGKPILCYLLDSLDFVDEFIIVVGHLADKVKACIGESYAGVRVTYVHQHELNGTAGALKVAKPKLRKNFLVFNSDDLYGVDDIKNLASQPSILVKAVDDVRQYGEVVLEGDVPKKIIEKPLYPKSNLANIGAYHFPLRAVELLNQVPLSSRGEYEITDLVQLCFDRNLLSYTLANFWMPVGTPDQLFDAHEILNSLPYVHPSSSVHKDCGERIIVYEGCKVLVPINNSIVVPFTTIEHTVSNKDTTIYKNEK